MAVVGYTFHAGDVGMHAGHTWQLVQCRKHCDYLIVGILTDRAIASYKREPIIPYAYRVIPYEACRYVDQVVPQDSRDPTNNLRTYKPDVLFHGDDWSDFPGKDYIESIGGRAVSTPYFHELSTTSIIQTIVERYAD